MDTSALLSLVHVDQLADLAGTSAASGAQLALRLTSAEPHSIAGQSTADLMLLA